MKKFYITYRNLLILLIIASMFSCTKKNSKDDFRINISNTAANKNITGSNSVFLRGTYFHYSFEASSKDKIVSYTISIAPKHQESSVPFYYAKHFETGLQPELKVADSLWIPDKCGTGNYKLTIALTNGEGNSEKALGFFNISEIYPNPLNIQIEKQPRSDSVYTRGNHIEISGSVEDSEFPLHSVEIFLVKNSDAYTDPVQSICLLEKDGFSSALSYDFYASITVGDATDHALVPKEIPGWDLGKAYIVIRAKDLNHNILYSKHIPLQVKDSK